jgi:hypothetical protein
MWILPNCVEACFRRSQRLRHHGISSAETAKNSERTASVSLFFPCAELSAAQDFREKRGVDG